MSACIELPGYAYAESVATSEQSRDPLHCNSWPTLLMVAILSLTSDDCAVSTVNQVVLFSADYSGKVLKNCGKAVGEKVCCSSKIVPKVIISG